MRTKNIYTFMLMKKYTTNNYNEITIVVLYKANEMNLLEDY